MEASDAQDAVGSVFVAGAAPAFRHGSWPVLAVAVAAAALLNVTLLATFVWTDLVGPQVRIMYWLSLGVAWSVAAVKSCWWNRGTPDRKGRAVGGEPFAKALDFYLQGNWLEAERILDRLIRDDPRDLEARLMLATLLRHTRRIEEATAQLNTLVRLEGARKWEMEISREGELLSEARAGARCGLAERVRRGEREAACLIGHTEL